MAIPVGREPMLVTFATFRAIVAVAVAVGVGVGVRREGCRRASPWGPGCETVAALGAGSGSLRSTSVSTAATTISTPPASCGTQRRGCAGGGAATAVRVSASAASPARSAPRRGRGAARDHPLRLGRRSPERRRRRRGRGHRPTGSARSGSLGHRPGDGDVELRAQPAPQRRGHRRRRGELRPQLGLVAARARTGRGPSARSAARRRARRRPRGRRSARRGSARARRSRASRPTGRCACRGPREHRLGQPEVRHVDVTVAVDQQVRGLDVAVDEAGAVDRVQRRARLGDDVRRRRRLERAAAGAPASAGRRRPRSASRCRRCRRPCPRRRPGSRSGARRSPPRAPRRGSARARPRRRAAPGAITFSATTRSSPRWTRAVDDAHPAAADQRLDPVAGHHRAGSKLPHLRCISEPGVDVEFGRTLTSAVRMSRRGPEQAPARDPPPDWAPPSPRGPAMGPGREEAPAYPARIAPLPASTSRGTATRTPTRSRPRSATPS